MNKLHSVIVKEERKKWLTKYSAKPGGNFTEVFGVKLVAPQTLRCWVLSATTTICCLLLAASPAVAVLVGTSGSVCRRVKRTSTKIFPVTMYSVLPASAAAALHARDPRDHRPPRQVRVCCRPTWRRGTPLSLAVVRASGPGQEAAAVTIFRPYTEVPAARPAHQRSTAAGCTRSSTCTLCRRCFWPPFSATWPPSNCCSTTAPFQISSTRSVAHRSISARRPSSLAGSVLWRW